MGGIEAKLVHHTRSTDCPVVFASGRGVRGIANVVGEEPDWKGNFGLHFRLQQRLYDY